MKAILEYEKQYIWIAQTPVFCIAAAHFDTLIDRLCDRNILNENCFFIGDKKTDTLKNFFGAKWKDALKSFSSKKINSQVVTGYNLDIQQTRSIYIKKEKNNDK